MTAVSYMPPRGLESLLAQLSLDSDACEALIALHRALPRAKTDAAQTPEQLGRLLLSHLGQVNAWESQRVRKAREALHARFGSRPAVAPALFAGGQRLALAFSGQGNQYWSELVRAHAAGGTSAQLLDKAAPILRRAAEQYDLSLDLHAWLTHGGAPEQLLHRAPLSFPLVFLAQAARLLALHDAGVTLRPYTVATIGHSQGILGALYASELASGLAEPIARACAYAEFLLCFGARVQDAVSEERRGEATPMAAMTGWSTEAVVAAIAASAAPVTLALDNGTFRKVVAGAPSALERFRRFLVHASERQRKLKQSGRFAGPAHEPEWTYLAVSAPFHTQALEPAVEPIMADAARLGFDITAAQLGVPVVPPNGEGTLDQDIVTRAVRSVCCEPQSYARQLSVLLTAQSTAVLDFGPSDAVAKLQHSNLRGSGVHVLALSRDEDWARALSAEPLPELPSYARFLPARSSRTRVANRFSRAFGRPPVFLAGMTPTTAEAPIVAAALNAGFLAELAGGGQVSEPILRTRVEELARTLVPGQGIVFNALYLDAYLWKLHFGPDRLLLRLRDEGYPIMGVTISAGIPPPSEAVELLRELNAHGIWLNSFKPGNDGQLRDVLAIADACPDLTIGVQIEGGKAGGHHSWEDLDDLLLRHYGELRARDNIILCVGGGVGEEQKAARYLRGTWHGGRALVAMPVDGVFLGTVAMAAKEAKTSAAVKQALVAAKGVDRPVLDGDSAGGVTSGRSQLDAHIHYLDNHAARVGRLLDAVAGDEGVVRERRAEIIAALNATAKPYFGDVAEMTYAQLLARMLELTAIGRHGAYEDGVWPDVSYRERFRLLLERAQARLATDKAEPVVALQCSLDDPQAALAALLVQYPQAQTTRLHATDVDYFVEVCRRPGKPVCFVPVIDGEVRRWYKSDSLWQSHDDRYAAEQVLSIPGPEAVSGIVRADEPVGHILARFNDAVAAELPEDKGEHWPGPLGAALSARHATTGERLVDNPLIRLFSGEQAAIERDGRGMVVRATSHLEGKLRAEAVLAADGAISVRLFSTHAKTGEAVPLELHLRWDGGVAPEGALRWDFDRYLEAQQGFYGTLLFDDPTLSADQPVSVSPARLQRFVTAIGHQGPSTPLSYAFSLSWKAIFRALSAARPDVMALVHEDNVVEAGPAWPPPARGTLDAQAELIACEATPSGLRLQTRAVLSTAAGVVAVVTSRFFVRGQRATQRIVRFSAALVVRDEAERQWLEKQAWLSLALPLTQGVRYTLTDSTLADPSGEVVARCSAPIKVLAAVAKMFAADRGPVAFGSPKELGEAALKAPASMEAYALASGDLNPLHIDAAVARFGGWNEPIVHGMWTKGALEARCLAMCDLRQPSLRRIEARFTSAVMRDELLTVSLRQTGLEQGGAFAAVEARARRGDDNITVLSGEVTFAPPKTAYIFPGQGIQAQGMGMAGYARSAAARAVWDEAEAVCRRELGFSLLRVVRENPRELLVRGATLRHPSGVLYLTQFTQAAMAVMAVAQVAELKERGAFVADAAFAGHSVGEYSALAAVSEEIPLSAIVQVVYQRGATMDHLITRDAHGHSPYGMGVVRPHDAGLDEAGMQAFVNEVRSKLGLPLEIVNYNIRGKQYSVTGDTRALAALERALVEEQLRRRIKAKRPAYLTVPGIDVPFHSSLLRDGVDEFRQTLQRLVPQHIGAEHLVGRYIPNLVARPFALTREFVAETHRASGSPTLEAALTSWPNVGSEFARTLLIELLAYQFASPVRWIETQDVLLNEAAGLERLIEIGAAEQPVLSNMAKAMLALDPTRLSSPAILNSEAHYDALALLPMHAAAMPIAAVQVPEAAPAAAAKPAAVEPRVTVAAAPRTAARSAQPVDALTTGLSALLALQAKLRVEQIRPDETLDELLGGNSARRNQVLADVGAEMAVQAVDGAHEIPLQALAAKLRALAPRYALTGRYLTVAVEHQLQKGFAAAGLGKKDIVERVAGVLPADHVQAALIAVALRTRTGDSTRGGPLGDAPQLRDRAAAMAWLDTAITDYATAVGLSLDAHTETVGAAVDPRAVRELEAKILGRLREVGDVLREHQAPIAAPVDDSTAERLRLYESEHGQAYEKALAPLFDAHKHVQWTSSWAWAERDLLELYHRLMRGGETTDAALTQLAARLGDKGLAMAQALSARAKQRGATAVSSTLASLCTRPAAVADLVGKTALVTGASPGSLAFAVARQLLTRGARVVVTTASYNDARLRQYQALYMENAVAGAELHVVPFNQASFADVSALCEWLLTPAQRTSAGSIVTIKDAWLPDLMLPFAAVADSADLSSMGDASLVTLRVLLLGIERLLAGLAERCKRFGYDTHRCHVVLPFSPNHGAFGGDGAYAECKAALETVLHKWRSEHEAWGRFFTLAGARIGWVRGTALMQHNDRLARELEASTPLRTFSTEEMATELASLWTEDARARAVRAPIMGDFSGGLDKLDDLSERAKRFQQQEQAARRIEAKKEALTRMLQELLGEKPAAPAVVTPEPLPRLHPTEPAALDRYPDLRGLDLKDVMVIVGVGEVGPWGSSRTRWEMERDGKLSLEGAVELAWMMGLIKPRPAAQRGLFDWMDAETEAPIAAIDVKAKYEARILSSCGIRVVEGTAHGYDPARALSVIEVHLERDFEFGVDSREEGETFVAADPEGTELITREGGFAVRRKKGATVRVPRALQMDRFVAGQVPDGWDPQRYGVSPELVAQVDRVTLYNLIATVEAFMSAGLEPEDLYEYLHPSRVGSAQSLGLGGMQKLRRLFLDQLLGNDRQSDAVQETLTNVVTGYAVQAYVGSYGTMSAPVGACATAAVSLADAMSKLQAGVADFVVTGGADDFGLESVTGFGDMNATANNRDLEARGISPRRMCRPNDRRRDGFLEAHGAGALLLCRANVAVDMGLPVYGVVGYAGTFGDGVQQSVPAPGIGALASAPAVKAALERFQLSADDIAVVSKHDTSTKMNDVNENRVHTWLQGALGRSPHLPLTVISQKSLTGHPKGAAAAWQMIGLMQAMADGVVPGNANLEDVDPAMREFDSLVFTDRSIRFADGELKAGLVTSLGFGHVSALVLLLHPACFWRMLPDDARADYGRRMQTRKERGDARLQAHLAGKRPAFVRRTHRLFEDEAQEARVLMDPNARISRPAKA